MALSHGEWSADVDEELARLILEMWRAGIETVSCCQDVGEVLQGAFWERPHLVDLRQQSLGRATLDLPDLYHLCRLCDAIANSGPTDAFDERMRHWASPGAWLVLDDWTVSELADEDEPDWSQPSRFEPAMVQLRFPRTDIGEMVERLRRHNQGEAVELGQPSWATVTLTEEEAAAEGLPGTDS